MTLSLTCPKCGFVGGAGVEELKAAGERAAGALTDAAMAENYRETCRVVVRSVLPEAMWRLPLRMVDRMGDSTAIELGRVVLARLLRPSA